MHCCISGSVSVIICTDPDPPITKQNKDRKTLISLFRAFFLLFYF
jgi:hypothetical protein